MTVFDSQLPLLSVDTPAHNNQSLQILMSLLHKSIRRNEVALALAAVKSMLERGFVKLAMRYLASTVGPEDIGDRGLVTWTIEQFRHFDRALQTMREPFKLVVATTRGRLMASEPSSQQLKRFLGDYERAHSPKIPLAYLETLERVVLAMCAAHKCRAVAIASATTLLEEYFMLRQTSEFYKTRLKIMRFRGNKEGRLRIRQMTRKTGPCYQAASELFFDLNRKKPLLAMLALMFPDTKSVEPPPVLRDSTFELPDLQQRGVIPPWVYDRHIGGVGPGQGRSDVKNSGYSRVYHVSFVTRPERGREEHEKLMRELDMKELFYKLTGRTPKSVCVVDELLKRERDKKSPKDIRMFIASQKRARQGKEEEKAVPETKRKCLEREPPRNLLQKPCGPGKVPVYVVNKFVYKGPYPEHSLKYKNNLTRYARIKELEIAFHMRGHLLKPEEVHGARLRWPFLGGSAQYIETYGRHQVLHGCVTPVTLGWLGRKGNAKRFLEALFLRMMVGAGDTVTRNFFIAGDDLQLYQCDLEESREPDKDNKTDCLWSKRPKREIVHYLARHLETFQFPVNPAALTADERRRYEHFVHLPVL